MSVGSLEELREGVKGFGKLAGEAADVAYVDLEVPARDEYGIKVRLFNHDIGDESSVLIYYPGCAFVFDLFEVNSVICSRIAHSAKIKVILVQFRLAPENPMPTSLFDGWDAATYIAKNSKFFGIDCKKIFLGGWCSGAHCSVVVANHVIKNNDFKVHHQILMSGSFDLTNSYRDFDDDEKKDNTLRRDFLSHIAEQYYSIKEPQDPLFSPYFETHFDGYPPTTILCGEFDALRNDSEGYYQKLKAAKVDVEKIVLKGQNHNTIAMRSIICEEPDPAEVIGKFIRYKLN